MKKKISALILLITLAGTGCGEASGVPVVTEVADAAETPAKDTKESEYPLQNKDGSYSYKFEFKNDYLSADFAGIDVLDATEDYPRERFEDVFMYSKGAYLNDPDVPPEFFDEWGYSCAACDCKIKGDPEFGFNCTYSKNIDGTVTFLISDLNYTMAVRWEKGQTLYTLWDNDVMRIKYERVGKEYPNLDVKEILAHNDLVGADAKAFVDSFDDGLYDKVLSTLSDNKTAYSPLFHFDNGVMRAKNVDDEALGTDDFKEVGFEFYLPNLGRRVFEVIVDKPTGRIFCTSYRTLYPGENFDAYPAGVEWNESGPVTPAENCPVFEPAEQDDTEKEETPEESASKTGVVIDEEEFQHGVMMSAKQGTVVNDDFATGVRNSVTAQLNGMGATEASDPGSLIYRRVPIRLGTSAEEAANAVINDVLPMYGFDVTGKNYYFAKVEKFDNGYVVNMGWTGWN
ncbi:MAG: hypothetical protein K6G10_01790 [Butyrivibrio sp.]|nr:hypothetical protein [Butyrivibrio sp.]